MEYIIIKHYTSDIDCDYREITMEKAKQTVAKMKDYALSHGKRIVYITIANSLTDGLPVSSDAFAEVEYTNYLSAKEKESYVGFLRELSMNEEYSARNDHVKLHCTLRAIKFKQIDDEFLII